ncbi:MAG: hypothetical protein RIB60_01385 [Phycisphaerales bacterium]
MQRSAGTWFVIALVMGVIAFIATLLLAPMPGDGSPAPTEEELAARAERQRVRQIVAGYNNERNRLISSEDWELIAHRARDVIEVAPAHHWAHLDLLHAMKKTGAGDAAFQRRLAELDAVLVADPTPSQGILQAVAARGWHDWFAGDEESARDAWRRAAQLATTGASAYVEAGYLSLAGEDDAAIDAWRRALDQGWANPSSWSPDPMGYARADYDNVRLVEDPRFEQAFDAWVAQQEAARAQRDELEAEHEAAHPPIGSPNADEDADGGP